MFNPNYALFEFSSSGNTYQPSPKSYINPDHLNFFKFIGRIVGKALS
jgi:E3 ubiquitin-protein ligase HUWE1